LLYNNSSCSWCSARDECILADDIDSLSGCFDSSTCPPLAAVNLDVFEGKLVVTNDGSFGGALDVGGSCSVKGCHGNHHYSLSVDEHNVKVKSAGSYLCLLSFMCENIVKLIEIVTCSKGVSVLFFYGWMDGWWTQSSSFVHRSISSAIFLFLVVSSELVLYYLHEWHSHTFYIVHCDRYEESQLDPWWRS
jgi:hypothetical protein